jgi:hypothetical protein
VVKAMLRSALWFALIAAIVWCWTLWQWDRTHRDISQADIVLQLLALPLVLFAGLLLLRWGWQASGRAPEAPRIRPAAVASTPPMPSPAPAEAGCLLLAQAVSTAAGNGAAELPAALREGRVRPTPDAALRDDEDLAPFSTRVDGLDDAAAAATPHADTPPARLLRSLALLESCLPALDAAGPWLDLLLARMSPPARPGGDTIVPTELAARGQAFPGTPLVALPAHQAALQPGAPAFDIWLALSPELPPAAADTALSWLAARAGTLPGFEPRAHRLLLRRPRSGVTLLAEAQQQLVDWQRAGRAGLLLVLAADSLLDDAALLQPARLGLAINGRRTKGLSLGEAGVALLLGTRGLARHAAAAQHAPQAPAARCVLPPLATRSRDKSADADGRVGPEAAQAVLEQALRAPGLAGATATHLATDADLRPSRSTELYGAVLEHAAHLDVAEDLSVLGVALGDCGIAAAPLALATAAAVCARTRLPAAWLSVIDAHARGAGLVLPGDPDGGTPTPTAPHPQ